MAYDNIDFESAKNAINQCKNAINYSYSKGVVDSSGISTTNWDADCRNIYTNALKTLVNTRYKALEDELDKCLESLNSMSNVSKLQEDSSYYERQISNKTYELEETKRIVANSGNPSNAYDAQRLMENKRKISNLEEEIRNLRYEKAEIDRQINQYDV